MDSLDAALVPAILTLVPPLEFIRAVVATCKKFSLDWYIESAFGRAVTVPNDSKTINGAINKLASHEFGSLRQGIVLVKPGVYAESVRVTHNCYIFGLGPRDKVIVEAPGWESALVSAGLGGRKVPSILGWSQLTSGEDANVDNMSFRCRNELMCGRCIYIVMGQLHLLRCNIDGGVLVSGACTAPKLSECCIRKSRGNGLRLTDHCHAALRRSQVLQHGHHGVLIERHAACEIVENSIIENKGCGIRIFSGHEPVHANSKDLPHLLRPSLVSLEGLGGNRFDKNGGGECSITPRFAETDEEDE